METKIKNLVLALCAVFTFAAFSACSSDDDDPVNTAQYYFQFSKIETNLTAADGSSKTLVDAIFAEFDKATNADSNGKISIGKTTKESALSWFNKTINDMVTQYDQTFKGKLPEGGYYYFYFTLYKEGFTVETATIYITNDGAVRK